MSYYNSSFNIGDILTRPKRFGIVEVMHCGIVVGHDAVLHNTPEKNEHVTTLRDFSEGAPVKVHRTGLSPAIVWKRVQEILSNPKRYDVVNRNCEHTVSEVAHGKPMSPQMKSVLIGIGILVAAFVGLCLLKQARR